MAATALYGRGMKVVDLMLRNRLFSILRILITAAPFSAGAAPCGWSAAPTSVHSSSGRDSTHRAFSSTSSFTSS